MDLQLMRRRMSRAAGTEATLLAATGRRQVRGQRLTVSSIVAACISAVLLLLAPATCWPDSCMSFWPGLGWLAAYLARDSIRSFNPLRELVFLNARRSCAKRKRISHGFATKSSRTPGFISPL